jgi:hypothetical protein
VVKGINNEKNLTLTLTLSYCHNPSLELATKVRACEVASQKRSLGVTFHVFGSVGEGEGMNPHIPKWTLTLGVGVLMDFQILRRRLQGSKLIGLKSSLYHWKTLGTQMFKMGLHYPFGYLNISYGQKKGQESNWQFDSWPLKVENCSDLFVCHTYRWKALYEAYNFALYFISIGGL